MRRERDDVMCYIVLVCRFPQSSQPPASAGGGGGHGATPGGSQGLEDDGEDDLYS